VTRCRIVIFAKAPRAGYAKTRLIPAIGAENAAKLAEKMLHHTVIEALAAKVGSVEICAYPAYDTSDWQPFADTSWKVLWSSQGEGDLGERLIRAAERVIAEGFAPIFVGTDCPELDRYVLMRAAERLTHHDAVIIPSTDGGYVLLGMCKFSASVFEGIPWSTNKVTKETFKRIDSLQWKLASLSPLSDIDEPADLNKLPNEWRTFLMHDIVKDYYGKKLTKTEDLKTSACCDASSVPSWLKPMLAKIHPDVLARYYGCGLVCPTELEGRRVLDLGCGTGRDVYALAQMVGPSGSVVGVDMTEEQLAVAQKYKAHHAQAFGFDNLRFIQGYIEKLNELDLQPATFDVIVSNCVINLSPDKASVLKGIYTLLKEGGEFYFSDVYADRRVPEEVRNDPVLYGECLGGALYWNDFITLAKAAGFADPRLVEDRPLEVTDPKLKARTGNIRFFSATYRLFKLPNLESACEDYGQAVVYKGTISQSERNFVLDKHHTIAAGKVFPVCGNTWQMLHNTRFANHFDFLGSFDQHFGIFEGCGAQIPFHTQQAVSTTGNAGCC